MQDSFEKLEALATLERDWDGSGALPLSRTTVDKTREILSEIERIGVIGEPDKVVPSPDGSIILAWLTPNGLVEAEIDKDGIFTF